MDANRFDTLSRQFGTAKSRRGVLRLVGALPLLGALASLKSEQTGAETPLDRVGDRAEQHQQRQDRQDRHEQRKGKRSDGGGDQNKGNDPGERNTTTSPPPPTCAESCASNCALCVSGPGAPTRCVSSVSSIATFCNFGCDSDDHCLNSRPDFPFCVARWVDRATGQVTEASDGCAGVAPYSPAYCSQMALCA
jgi:hypothetical protein